MTIIFKTANWDLPALAAPDFFVFASKVKTREPVPFFLFTFAFSFCKSKSKRRKEGVGMEQLKMDTKWLARLKLRSVGLIRIQINMSRALLYLLKLPPSFFFNPLRRLLADAKRKSKRKQKKKIKDAGPLKKPTIDLSTLSPSQYPLAYALFVYFVIPLLLRLDDNNQTKRGAVFLLFLISKIGD